MFSPLYLPHLTKSRLGCKVRKTVYMRYITHFFTTEGLRPLKGKRRIVYLTTKDDEDDFFLQTDSNPLPKELVQGMIDRNEIVAFVKKVPFPENQSLFIDQNGELTLADRLDAEKNISVVGVYDPVLKKLFQE